MPGVFELPSALLEPALRALRLGNTMLDMLFYDTGAFARALLWRGESLGTHTSRAGAGARIAEPGFGRIDFAALTDPEGAILIVDAAKAPFVTRFDRVDDAIAHLAATADPVETVTLTGIGGSALGAAAFAWNVSTALGQRVAAIVPGYGMADWTGQALGGWFGPAAEGALAAATQHGLDLAVPRTARIGRALQMSVPGGAADKGCPAADVLHALLRHAPGLRNLIGHGKGALAIGHALRALPGTTTKNCHVITFGCAIEESAPAASYTQFLGVVDGWGALSAWGGKAGHRPFAHHGTNSAIPFSLPVALLSRLAMAEAEKAQAQRAQQQRARQAALKIVAPVTGSG
jgi:hypothetical protein